ncbi:MAG: HU family DNA-binding protein [Bacteroides fragilis]
MTQKELIVAISRKTGYKAEMVENIMAAYIDIAIKEFMKKRSIRLRQLGTLRYVQAIMHNGYNPVKGRHEVFKGRNKIKFIPSRMLDKVLNMQEEN